MTGELTRLPPNIWGKGFWVLAKDSLPVREWQRYGLRIKLLLHQISELSQNAWRNWSVTTGESPIQRGGSIRLEMNLRRFFL